MVSLGFLGLHHLISYRAWGIPGVDAPGVDAPGISAPGAGIFSAGYGDLQPDPQGLLNLPKGFSYQIIFRQGHRMDDGFFSPDRPDGMGTFAVGKDKLLLIRNHEISPDGDKGPYGQDPALIKKIDRRKVYDFGQGIAPSTGGTTTLLYNENTGKVASAYLSLTGTNRNCAGGVTPWKSWISCEENVDRAGGNAEKDHGYNFEVPATEKIGLAHPVPLKDMGRFNHEAVAVDPNTSIVYETEDRPDGLIYRYLPSVPRQLHKGGKLQVLAIKQQKSYDTRNWKDLTTPTMPQNQLMEVVWLDIDQVTSPEDDLRYRGFARGGARFARGEGMWYGNQEIFFACTNGGEIGRGQVFRYVPSPYEGTAREKEKPGKLSLFLETNNTEMLKSCDNLTVAPWGDLVICEDDPHPFVVGVTPQGEYYKLAENVGFPSEFAGGVFSPSGRTYFVNIQDAGFTLAITGPWKQG